MPTNDERREVAAMLRAQAKQLGPRMDAHEFAHYCADAIDRENALRWDQMTLRLADLIEPEERTCRILSYIDQNPTPIEEGALAEANGVVAYE